MPFFEGWSVVADVTMSLVMSGRADLIDLGNVIVVSLVGDEYLHLRC